MAAKNFDMMGLSSSFRAFSWALLLLIAFSLLFSGGEAQSVSEAGEEHSRKLMGLVRQEPLILHYHRGPILSGVFSFPVYTIWYGQFSFQERSAVLDFLSSLNNEAGGSPNVRDWWNVTQGYKDKWGSPVAPNWHLGSVEAYDSSLKGKYLTIADLEELVVRSLKRLPVEVAAMYMVFTAADVYVESFCGQACGSHFYTSPSDRTQGQQLAWGWVGNAGVQCPGRCAWPFAKPSYLPASALTLIPPTGAVGTDGMIINLAIIMVGIATDPYHNAYYQGDASVPLEGASACVGIFGEGAYPGYPGRLLVDGETGASFNVFGIEDRKFLLPAIWDPTTLACNPPSQAEMAMQMEDVRVDEDLEMAMVEMDKEMVAHNYNYKVEM